MADTAIASAVALPEDENDSSTHANGLKRRLSDLSTDEKDMEKESKRQRMSPGKNSPTAPRDGDAPANPPALDVDTKEQPKDPREARRKSSVADEKQRSKRLFGALLGSLNQPRDRTSKRRQEIESRRKAELQRQDDERIEDKQRRQERLAEQRKKAFVKVEEENVHIRHRNMLNRASYLQTVSEPVIFYKPWDLRPDEEDRIDEQIRDAQAQIDRQLDEFDERHGQRSGVRDSGSPMKTTRAHGDNDVRPGATAKDNANDPDTDMADQGDQTPAKSANIVAKPAEVPESPTDISTNSPSHEQEDKVAVEPDGGREEIMEVEGEHIQGDEDSVIY